MAIFTVEEMTNYYLYGTKFKPSDLTDESLIRSENDGADIEVSRNQYMDEVWDSIITPSQFEVIELFFNEVQSPALASGQYNLTQILVEFGMDSPNLRLQLE